MNIQTKSPISDKMHNIKVLKFTSPYFPSENNEANLYILGDHFLWSYSVSKYWSHVPNPDRNEIMGHQITNYGFSPYSISEFTEIFQQNEQLLSDKNNRTNDNNNNKVVFNDFFKPIYELLSSKQTQKNTIQENDMNYDEKMVNLLFEFIQEEQVDCKIAVIEEAIGTEEFDFHHFIKTIVYNLSIHQNGTIEQLLKKLENKKEIIEIFELYMDIEYINSKRFNNNRSRYKK